jgi:hypothetical protein
MCRGIENDVSYIANQGHAAIGPYMWARPMLLLGLTSPLFRKNEKINNPKLILWKKKV